MNTDFTIPVNLLIEELHVKYENSELLSDNPSFVSPELYAPASTLHRENLVVGMLSEILPVAETLPDITFLCIRDRFTDEFEKTENMKNILVLLTNQKLPELFNQLIQIFQKIRNWNMNMMVSTASNKGIQDLIDLSQDMIGNHIDIMDATFKLLAYTKEIPLDDPITQDLISYGYHSQQTVNELRKHKRFEEYEKEDGIIISDDYKLCKYVTIKRVFHLNNTPALYVVMHCNHREVNSGLLCLFKMLLNHIAHYINRDSLYPAAFAASQQYIKDLLDGNIKSVDEAVSRASYATIPFQQKYQLYLIAFDDNFNTPLDNLTVNITKELPFSYVVSYHRRIVILHNCKRQVNNVETVKHALQKTLVHFPCIIGISNPFENLWETRAALEQAGCAIEYGSHMERTPEAHCEGKICFYDFEQCFLTLLVAKSFNSTPDIFRNCFMIKAIHTLNEYDRQHNSNLLGTLKTYLQCNKKATETCELLHMHRNTVLYHIDRIEQLLNISLNDADVCLKLQLGIETFQTNMIEMLL